MGYRYRLILYLQRHIRLQIKVGLTMEYSVYFLLTYYFNLDGYLSFSVIVDLRHSLFFLKVPQQGFPEIYLHILVLPPLFCNIHPIHYTYSNDRRLQFTHNMKRLNKSQEWNFPNYGCVDEIRIGIANLFCLSNLCRPSSKISYIIPSVMCK